VSDEQTNPFEINETQAGERLDKVLAAHFEDASRMFLKELIDSGQVLINGQVLQKANIKAKLGDVLTVTFPESKPLDLLAEDIPIDILFQDEHLAIVNKPVGMLTHPSGREQTGTLVNALLFHFQQQLSGINGVERPGIVHRLDRETSGLMMVAKTDKAHQKLQQQIQARSAKRHYRAIAQGIVGGDLKSEGSIFAPIGRNPKHRDKMCITNAGRLSITHWTRTEVLSEKLSVLSLQLETGRTHQIRVHLAHIGHPILNDPLYGTGLGQYLKMPVQGQLLQAYKLHLTHPFSQEPLAFEIDPDEKWLLGYEFAKNWAQQ
jgi:23S rRNA pseudouridine1911/1915/1917 synthase